MMNYVLTKAVDLIGLPVGAIVMSQNGTAWEKHGADVWRPARSAVIPYDSQGVLDNSGDTEADQWVVVLWANVIGQKPVRCDTELPGDRQCVQLRHAAYFNHRDSDGIYFSDLSLRKGGK